MEADSKTNAESRRRDLNEELKKPREERGTEREERIQQGIKDLMHRKGAVLKVIEAIRQNTEVRRGAMEEMTRMETCRFWIDSHKIWALMY